jgi:hypothetical protein
VDLEVAQVVLLAITAVVAVAGLVRLQFLSASSSKRLVGQQGTISDVGLGSDGAANPPQA